MSLDTRAREIARRIRRVPPANATVERLAQATMGVRLETLPAVNRDVVEAGLAYAVGLWWLAASGSDVARADVRDFAQLMGDELVAAVGNGAAKVPA